MAGQIVNISAEAQIADSTANRPTFGVRASFAVPDDTVRKNIRIGMSARMTIQTYINPKALIVPLSAVVSTGNGHQVRIDRGGVPVAVPVSLGRTFPERVEIISGISPGTRILTAPDS